MTGTPSGKGGNHGKSMFGSMYASLGAHVHHKRTERKSAQHSSFTMYPNRHRGDILMGFIRSLHRSNEPEYQSAPAKLQTTGTEDPASMFLRASSAPEPSFKGTLPFVSGPASPGVSAVALHKGFVEIRRQRVLGFSWTRVWAIVSPGEMHVVQNVPTQHHVHKLKDFHLSPACCKKNNIFILTPNEEVETGKEKKDVGNKLIFRVPTTGEKETWISALNRAKDCMEHQEMLAVCDKSESPVLPEEPQRRQSLPRDFGSSTKLECVREESESQCVDELSGSCCRTCGGDMTTCSN